MGWRCGGLEARSELAALACRIRRTNRSHGRAEDDGETGRLAAQRHRVEVKMGRMIAPRMRLGGAPSVVVDQPVRLPLVAVRRALSQRAEELVERPTARVSSQRLPGAARSSWSAMADGLALEVADPTLS